VQFLLTMHDVVALSNSGQMVLQGWLERVSWNQVSSAAAVQHRAVWRLSCYVLVPATLLVCKAAAM
jgi:hypothetical protein